MQKTNINPVILQQFLESAVNAADKGQSQFFTPPDFAARLAAGLPKIRPTLLDLNCGNGQLVQASANQSTTDLLGSDIDPCRCTRGEAFPKHIPSLPVNKISHDVTRLYGLLKEISFTADCFVLNPPWRLFWHRDRFQQLAQSELATVRQAFKAIEPGAPKGTIDSTAATILMALDLMTVYGEAVLIANNNTLDRLLFGDKATHGAVAQHIWLRLIIPGNPMTGESKDRHEALDDFHGGTPNPEGTFHTGVIYFAREHTTGPHTLTVDSGLGTVDLRALRVHRHGAELTVEHWANQQSGKLWRAAKDRVTELEGAKPRVEWNIWLTTGGRIRTALSAFQEHSVRVDKKEAARLFSLQDKTPMELVLQRNQRDDLLHVVENRGTGDFPWRVQPALLAAVRQAVQDYHAARAPLYPLPPIQRLGYLDEQDTIACEKDLLAPDGRLAFKAGTTYPIRTQTVKVTRKKQKPNPFTGEIDEIELSGQELAIYLLSTEIIPSDPKNDDAGTEFAFMDATLKNDENTKVETAKQAKDSTENQNAIDFTLQQLCGHFTIPEVPDVATNNPAGYETNLQTLTELETLCP